MSGMCRVTIEAKFAMSFHVNNPVRRRQAAKWQSLMTKLEMIYQPITIILDRELLLSGETSVAPTGDGFVLEISLLNSYSIDWPFYG